jgi:DNA-binding transcriptional regulator GbsR (MarR family)
VASSLSEPTERSAASVESLTPEDVRVAFADIWGDMGPAWNVTPSVARVHGYLLIWGSLLTERDVREALGLSHRAASLALTELEDWGLVERFDEARREGRPGPPAVAWRVVGDRWRWFQRVAEERRAREADPLQPRLATCIELADQVVAASPDDHEAQHLRAWLAEIQGFVTLFERALRTLSRADSGEIARGFTVLSRISDDTLDGLLRILASLPEDELAQTLEAIARTSPTTARRVMRAANRVARLAR